MADQSEVTFPSATTAGVAGGPAAYPGEPTLAQERVGTLSPPWRTIEVRPQRRRIDPGLLVWPAAAAGVLAMTLFVGVMAATLAHPRAADNPGPPQPAPAAAQTSDYATAGAEPAANGHAQAAAIDALLAASSASRARLTPGLTQLDRCGDVRGVMPLLQQVRDERNDQVNRAESLDVGAIEGGSGLKQLLVDALRRSRLADDAYLSWGRALLDQGCGPKLRYWDSAQNEQQRKAAKQRFITQWNRVAATYQLPTRSADEI